MPALCNVIGTIIAPNHAPLVRAVVAFHRIPAVVQPSREGLATIAPSPVSARTDATGGVSVFLEPGTYDLTIVGADNRRFPGYQVAVPNAATANLADIQALIAPAPVYVDEIRESVAAADAAARRAEEAAANIPNPETIVSVSGIRVVDGVLILDFSDGSTLEANLPAGGTGPVVPPVAISIAEPTAQRVYQRATDTGGAFSLGAASVPIGVTVDDAVSSLQYRLRDAVTDETLVDWSALSGAVAAGTHDLSADCPARLGQYLIDVRANGSDANIAAGENPFAVGAVILSAGQSQAMRTFGVVSGAAAPIAASGATVPAFGRVFGTYFDTQRTNSAPAWVAPADGTPYDSPFIPVFLAAEQARRGVTCAYVGCGVGASLAAEWVPGQTNWTRLLVSINEVDAWEGFIWHLGGSDATGGTTAASYMASLNSILAALDGLNGRGSDYDAVICSMGSRVATTDWAAVARIRQAAKDVAEARTGAIYAEPRDVDLVDTVHQTDAGNVRLARSMSRHLAAASAGAIAGPTVTGATLDGTALTLSVTHAPGATAMVATGDITSRLAVYPAGYAPTAGSTGRLAISSATVTANAINITLAAAPTTDVDVYVYPHPDTTGATLGARVIADNYTADGIPHGRQAVPTTDAPVTADHTGTVTPPESTYPVLTLRNGSAAYAAGRFGQAMDAGGNFVAVTAAPIRPAGRNWGQEGWVRMPTAARSNIAWGESGPNSAYMVVRAGGNSPLGQACISYEMADRTVIQLTGGPRIDDNEWHHVAVQFHDAGARLYVDGVQVATSAALVSAAVPTIPFSVGSFGNADTSFIWTGQIDEVRVWDGLEITEPFDPRTEAYSTLPANTVAYWAFEGNLNGGVAA
jgi:Concanavalin A-like lectin/glucanases superfamily